MTGHWQNSQPFYHSHNVSDIVASDLWDTSTVDNNWDTGDVWNPYYPYPICPRYPYYYEYKLQMSCPGCGRLIGCGDTYCRHCGKKLMDEKFCPCCGKKL